MSLFDVPLHWWAIGWAGATFLVLSFLVVSGWLSYRRAQWLPRRHWIAAILADNDDMARFEASDAVAVSFVPHEDFLRMAQEEPSMHKWRHQRLCWDVLELPTEEDQPAAAVVDWSKPEAAPSGVFLIERDGRWRVIIGPLATADHRHKILLDDEGYPWDTLTIEQVYRNWRHPRLPPISA